MSFKYKFTLSIGFSGAERSTTLEYDEEPPEKELEEDWKHWSNSYIDGAITKIEDK